jgi:seryl-tRNA synthetase
MLDPKYIREQADVLKEALAKRGAKIDLGPIGALDGERRKLMHQTDELRAEQNRATQAIAAKKKNKEDASGEIAAMKSVSDRIKELEESVRVVEAQLQEQILVLPNIPHESVPGGRDESANRFERKWGEPRRFDFEVKDHVDIGEKLGILDFQRASKIAGARFNLSFGAGARLERALINFMLDVHTKDHGYTEVLPPLMVNSDSLVGTGQLPKFAEDSFRTTVGDHWMIPTAEVPVTNIHRDEVLPGDSLPIRYVAFTPCFRSEAGSYGKDTRGMIRQHQFNKVELVAFVAPEESWKEHERLTSNAEAILQKLELPYRVMTLCSGDLGFASAKTYDLEVWLPGQNAYREISSCSNFTDFQARRALIRTKRDKKPEFVHTLNGSGLAVGRTVVAILENFQNADGSVTIPPALRPYMDGVDRIVPRT